VFKALAIVIVAYTLTMTAVVAEAANTSQEPQKAAMATVHDGYWWNYLTLNFKLGFASGYAVSMTRVSDVTGSECFLANGGSAQLPPNVMREKLTDCANSSPVARWDFQKITNGQLEGGVDAFYSDFRNKTVDIDDAMRYVRDQLKGKPAAELEKELEGIRASEKR
jgi:hypothetical protein